MSTWQRTWPERPNDFTWRQSDGWARVYLMPCGTKWYFAVTKNGVSAGSGIRPDFETASAAALQALGLPSAVILGS